MTQPPKQDGTSERTLFWRRDKKCKRWTVRRYDEGPVLGAVSFVFNGWDGTIFFPDKKWPDSQKSVRSFDHKFWSVRRDVEWAIQGANGMEAER